MRTIRLLIIAAIVAGVSLSARRSFAQTDSTQEPEHRSWFRVNGSLTVSGDYYSVSSSLDSNGYPLWPARRPPNLYRLIFNPTITLFNAVTLPFNIVLTSRETNTLTPASVSPTLWQYFSNPLNVLGVTFQPGVDWMTISLGTHTPRYSELTGSDIQIFGGGIMMTPGFVRLGFDAGISQRAIAPDTLNNIYGAYRRTLIMAKIGFGTEQAGYVDLNIAKVRDDTSDFAGKLHPVSNGIVRTQVATDTLGFPIYSERLGLVPLAAQDGVLVSISSYFPILDVLSFRAEASASALTRDRSMSGFDSLPITVPHFLLEPNASSHGDLAGLASLGLRFENWGVELKGKYVGAGFTMLTSPFAQSDYLDLTVSPSFRLFENTLLFNGTIGTRTDNYSQSEDQHTTQIIGAANLNVLLSDALSVAASFTNFGYRNNVTNDTLRIQSVSRSFSLTPTYTISGIDATHTITLSAGLDTYQDYNVVSSQLTNNNTVSLLGLYSVSLAQTPLTVTVASTYLKNSLPTYGFHTIGGSIDAAYRFLNDHLIPSVGMTLNSTTVGDHSADSQTILRFGLRWKITDHLSANATAYTNGYTYGSSHPGGSFRENTLLVSVTTLF